VYAGVFQQKTNRFCPYCAFHADLSQFLPYQCVSYCNIDAECQSVVQAQYRCFKESTSNTSALQSHGLCLHKRLFKPFHWKDALTILIIFTGSCVAAGAGVGGGALNVAMLVFIAGFSPSDAVPLSSVCEN
jgi:hypothetical protein